MQKRFDFNKNMFKIIKYVHLYMKPKINVILLV